LPPSPTSTTRHSPRPGRPHSSGRTSTSRWVPVRDGRAALGRYRDRPRRAEAGRTAREGRRVRGRYGYILDGLFAVTPTELALHSSQKCSTWPPLVSLRSWLSAEDGAHSPSYRLRAATSGRSVRLRRRCRCCRFGRSRSHSPGSAT
jgi:hypothetical protein